MISRSGLILASVILTALPSTAQPQSADSAMRVIRARYQRISDAASHSQRYESSLDSLGLELWAAGHGRFTASFEGDTLRTIVVKYSGARGRTTTSYYFWKGAPAEIRVHGDADKSGSPKQPAPPELRFYFDRGYLVRWVDPGHTIHPVTVGAVFARAMQLMADGSRLVDAARRTRDHMLEPPTPVEMVTTMQRELSAVMVAELQYYSETSKYSSDIKAIGYQPTQSVEIRLLDVSDRGWTAQATTAALPGRSCVAFLGKPKRTPKTSADHARPSVERDVACDRP
jgi:hypothetical protein